MAPTMRPYMNEPRQRQPKLRDNSFAASPTTSSEAAATVAALANKAQGELRALWFTLDTLSELTDAGPQLTANDVEWVVNEHGHLGVKIGSDFFWLYKGYSVHQRFADLDDGGARRYRSVGKREFGEHCVPKSWPNNPDADEWHDLPLDPEQATTRSSDYDSYVSRWVSTHLSHLNQEQHNEAVEHFSRPEITLREGGYYEFVGAAGLTIAHVSDRRSN